MSAPFDVGVIGEGEATFLELIERYLKTGDVKSSDIPGIVYRQNGSPVHTPPRPLIKDLESVPPPDRGIFDMRHYTGRGNI